MAVRPAIFLLLATLAAAAAGAGGWLAVRQNRADAASEGVAAASPTGPGRMAQGALEAAGPRRLHLASRPRQPRWRRNQSPLSRPSRNRRWCANRKPRVAGGGYSRSDRRAGGGEDCRNGGGGGHGAG